LTWNNSTIFSMDTSSLCEDILVKRSTALRNNYTAFGVLVYSRNNCVLSFWN